MADLKITELTEITTAASTDLLALVHLIDPLTQKIKVSNLFTRTVANNDNVVGLTINQNDTTNNKNGINIDQNGNGIGLNIDYSGNTKAIYALRTTAAAANTDGVITVGSNAVDGGPAIYATHTNASATGNVQTIVNAGTGYGLFIDQNGNGIALNIDNDGTQKSVYIDQGGNETGVYIANNGTGYAFDVNQIGANTTGVSSCHIYSNTAQTAGHGLLKVHMDNASSDDIVNYIINDGTGHGIFIDQNGNGNSFYIDKDCTVNDTRTWAAKIDSDNAGTGTALGCGIDMSSFSAEEPVLKVVADTNDPTGGGGAADGRIAIDVGGVTKYLPYYDA